jgi:hypothetical protein
MAARSPPRPRLGSVEIYAHVHYLVIAFRVLPYVLISKPHNRLGGQVANAEKGAVEVLLAEFAALRGEILQYLSMQWNIFVFQLTTTGIVFSFALTGKFRIGFLLIIPVVSYALGARYLQDDRAIKEIGTYIMNELSPRVPGGLEWEAWLRKRTLPKPAIAWFSPLPVIFPGTSLIALAWTAPYILYSRNISGASRWLLGIIWVLSLLITIIALYSIIGAKKPMRTLKELRHPVNKGVS